VQSGMNAYEEPLTVLRETALALGAYRAEIISVSNIKTEKSFRALCEANSCGNYGRGRSRKTRTRKETGKGKGTERKIQMSLTAGNGCFIIL